MFNHLIIINLGTCIKQSNTPDLNNHLVLQDLQSLQMAHCTHHVLLDILKEILLYFYLHVPSIQSPADPAGGHHHGCCYWLNCQGHLHSKDQSQHCLCHQTKFQTFSNFSPDLSCTKTQGIICRVNSKGAHQTDVSDFFKFFC